MYKMEQEIIIPKELNEAVAESMQQVRKIHKKQVIKKIGATVTGICLFCAVFCAWGFSHPVLAAQIPLVGKIFANLQHEVEFSGDFEENAVVLGGDTETEGKEDVKYIYTASDKGYDFSISEEYCDGESLYLGMTVKKEGGFGKISEGAEGLPAITLYDIHVQPDGFETVYEGGIPQLEGKQIAPDTFEGIIRVGLDQLSGKLPENCNMKVELGWFLYFDQNLLDAEEKNYEEHVLRDENGEEILDEDGMALFDDTYEPIRAKYNERGNWQMYIPVTVDMEHVKKYEIHDTAEGFGVQNVVVTPYEIRVEVMLPPIYETQEAYYEAAREFLRESYTLEDEYTLEDIDNMTWNELDEAASIAKFGDYGVAVFDQNGERIEGVGGSEEKSYGMDYIYPVKERNITELHLYVAEDSIACMKETDEQTMKEHALYTTVVEFEK